MEKIAIYENQNKPEAIKWAEFTINVLAERKLKSFVSNELFEKLSESAQKNVEVVSLSNFEKVADMVITFGGDGTILSAARWVYRSNIPIMGINVGKLGFLAEYPHDKIRESIDNLFNGEYRIVDRAILSTEVDGETLFAVNDFVIEKMYSSRMITLHTYSNDHYVASYRADGLIITTPTGSTAYSLASGGPIIAPSTKVVCITPISPHSLTFRPLVLPNENVVKVQIESPTGEAKLVADGQIEKILKNGDEVEFTTANYKIKLIKPLKSTYYDVLRAKLLWAVDPTSKKNCCEDNEEKLGME